MKLIIQIPCFNEEQTLAIALDALPKKIVGIDEIEVLIIDDGSTDRTVEVARANGVAHVVSFPRNKGLAAAFKAGLDTALRAGADIIVNTDADNQYCADDIETLVRPILDGTAEIVVGARPIADHPHFSPVKKSLQKFGSWVVRVVSGTDIPDAPSGFRAMSREAAMQLNVFNRYTYTLETIIQAGQKGISITSVPVRVNEDLRPSRLVRSIPSYIKRSIITILRIFMVYRPLRFFAWLGVVPFALGTLLGIRWAVLTYAFNDPGHVQSLILAAILLLVAVLSWVLGFVADLLAVNRMLLEEIRVRMRRHELEPAQTLSPPAAAPAKPKTARRRSPARTATSSAKSRS